MRDVMPQDIASSAEPFIAQVFTPLHQYRMSLSQDAVRRNLSLHFDNSGCHIPRPVSDEMTKL
jgi:hypothetical protein